MTKVVLLTCLTSTMFMTGLIWFVHIVHYPLFDRIDLTDFRRYHAEHARMTTYVVLVPMLMELITSLLLVGRCPHGVAPWLGLSLAVATWGVTFLFSVPAHERLTSGFDVKAHRRLVSTNGLRVLTWTAHSAVLLYMTARALR